jgi:phenylalanyl-tRNA synthetase alpha chain
MERTMTTSTLNADLALRDLTDPRTGPHAVQRMIDEILRAVAARYRGDLRLERGERIVAVADNYDRLGYGADARARDKRYTRYVDETRMLRSQTSALIPPVLRRLAADQQYEATVACPGLVYRRDVIDRLHTGTPHQMDLWHLTTTPSGDSRAELLELVATVLGAALPEVRWRALEAEHPYTEDGLEIEACVAGQWVEVGECGRAGRRVLAGAGLPPYVRGLALGLGLDRLVMLRKGVPDIRLLRSADPRVARQMLDLTPWRPVSAHPPARRDVSVAMRAGVTAEEVGDLVRQSLGDDARLVEEIAIRSVTSPPALPAAARERLGIRPDEVNVLLRVVLRDLDGSIPGEVANDLRDRIYTALHHPSDLAS